MSHRILELRWLFNPFYEIQTMNDEMDHFLNGSIFTARWQWLVRHTTKLWCILVTVLEQFQSSLVGFCNQILVF